MDNNFDLFEDNTQYYLEYFVDKDYIEYFVECFDNKKYFDYLSEKCKVEEITENDFKAKIVFSKEFSEKMDGKTMMRVTYELGKDFSLEYKNKRFIVYIIKMVKGKAWINNAIEFFENIS